MLQCVIIDTMIVVYSKPSCVQCTATHRALDSRGLSYRNVDMSTNPEALEYIRKLGHMNAPVVITDYGHWSGFRPDKIDELLRRLTS